MDLEILKIASDTKNHKVIDDYTHISKHKNPICGDEMQISLKISNDKIIDFGYQCKSCIYCQASVSMLSKSSINKSIGAVSEFINLIVNFFEKNNFIFPIGWKNFDKIFDKKNKSRKECLLLPFKTLAKALK
tara:strand:+ start:455 stop:850 length:396 start_codon:yes stop_codon:yes gene_type:complete